MIPTTAIFRFTRLGGIEGGNRIGPADLELNPEATERVSSFHERINPPRVAQHLFLILRRQMRLGVTYPAGRTLLHECCLQICR